MDNILKVLFSSMLPIIELRGAIPLGIALGLNPLKSSIISVLGSTLIVPFIFFTVRPVINFLLRLKPFEKSVSNFIERSLRKSKKIQKYEFLGLTLFVGIPLPGTGAWTGTIIAVLLDMRFKRTFFSIFLGNLMAGLIVYILSTTSIALFKWFV
ncbi:MAG: small multi-drug export protein [Caloramator sp.]|nr:small multi-drug export protein [Caloramator sp.]